MHTGQKFVFRAMCFPTSSCRLDNVMHSKRASLKCTNTNVYDKYYFIPSLYDFIKQQELDQKIKYIVICHLACCPTFPSKCRKPTKMVNIGNFEVFSLEGFSLSSAPKY